MTFPWHQYLLAVIFIAGGANHLRTPDLYKKVMPPYLPEHSTLVLVSGILEMVLWFNANYFWQSSYWCLGNFRVIGPVFTSSYIYAART